MLQNSHMLHSSLNHTNLSRNPRQKEQFSSQSIKFSLIHFPNFIETNIHRNKNREKQNQPEQRPPESKLCWKFNQKYTKIKT